MYAPTLSLPQPKPTRLSSSSLPPKQRVLLSHQCWQSLRPPGVSSPPRIQKPGISFALKKHELITSLLGAGIAVSLLSPALAVELPSLGSSIQLTEPSNALSLPTWAIHVSSVVEWITAMALVWQYGEKPGCEAWKSLSWGMVPLLGGAFCACTWHFFYNSESLEVLVALQAALTVVGNATMCIAAFRIYKSQGS